MSKAVVYTGWQGKWDQEDTGVTDVTIADGVTAIKYRAFAGCKGLTNLSFLKDSAISHTHMATKNNKLEAMDVLLRLGADVGVQIDKVGHTPMHYACMYGYKEATLKLLYAGGDAHMPNTTVLGRTPLETAKDSGFRPLFNCLLDAETKLRELNEEKAEAAELSKSKKHETLKGKMEALDRSNALMKKTLREAREDE